MKHKMDIQELRNFVAKDEILEVFGRVMDFTQQQTFPYTREIHLLSARFHALQREQLGGTISFADAQREAGVIRRDLLELLDLVEGWLQAGVESELKDRPVEQEIKELIRAFEQADRIQSVPSRLRTKNDIARKMAERFLQRPHLISVYSHRKEDGLIAGIAGKVRLAPEMEDLDILEKLAAGAGGHFARGTIVNAVAEIIYSGQILIGDDRRILQLLETLSEAADAPLQKNIERVRASLEYLNGMLSKEPAPIKWHDDTVGDQHARLQTLAERSELTSITVIIILSSLFDRGTFRFEPCIRSCTTQFWRRRWIAAYDTNRLVSAILQTPAIKWTDDQMAMLKELQQTLYRYYERMARYLFRERVDQGKLDHYLEKDIFPQEKEFQSLLHKGGEPMIEEIVLEINRPLRRSIRLMDRLLRSVKEDAVILELARCEGCFCE